MNLKPRTIPAAFAFRILAGFAFGLLAGFLIRHSGLGIVYLAGLSIATAALSFGLGASRLLVACAICLGQYVIFYASFPMPPSPHPEESVVVLMVRDFFVVFPGFFTFAGAFLGMMVENILHGGVDSARKDSATTE